MQIYILRPVEGDDLWEPWYDKAFGFIVSANSPAEARKLASEEAGDEHYVKWDDSYTYKVDEINPWLSAKHTTCKELRPPNKSQVIMKDFHAA